MAKLSYRLTGPKKRLSDEAVELELVFDLTSNDISSVLFSSLFGSTETDSGIDRTSPGPTDTIPDSADTEPDTLSSPSMPDRCIVN